MASRTFTDEHGVEWIVLAVSPTSAERRLSTERRVRDVGPKPGQPDRRKGGDRRRGIRTEPRVKISPGLTHGWLAFEGGGERRRLSPVPDDWRDASDAELRQLLARATPVARPGRLIE